MRNSVLLILCLFLARSTWAAEELSPTAASTIPESSRTISSSGVVDQHNASDKLSEESWPKIPPKMLEGISKPVYEYDKNHNIKSVTFEKGNDTIVFVVKGEGGSASPKAEIVYSTSISDDKISHTMTIFVSSDDMKNLESVFSSDNLSANSLDKAITELDSNYATAMDTFIEDTEVYYMEMRKRTGLKSREEIDDFFKSFSKRRTQTPSDKELLSTYHLYEKKLLIPSKNKLEEKMSGGVEKFNQYLNNVLKLGVHITRDGKSVEIIINLR